MNTSHREHVEALLSAAAAEHEQLVARLPPDLQASLPVDAQGLARAIDYLAAAVGLSEGQRRELIRPHAGNPAVLHARVFGLEPLSRDTVIASFVDGARVRADALTRLADVVGGELLGRKVREVLVAEPLPTGSHDSDPLPALRASYRAQERAAVLIAAELD